MLVFALAIFLALIAVASLIALLHTSDPLTRAP
jgi:hypothetical protein